MKKRRNQCLPELGTVQNPVAKFAHRFNKAQVYDDKMQYRRNAKHRKQEASVSIFVMGMLTAAFCTVAASH